MGGEGGDRARSCLAVALKPGTWSGSARPIEPIERVRLLPIDRNLKPPSPVGETAENRKMPPLARRTELLGTIALHSKAYW